jgi:hypothetical protein
LQRFRGLSDFLFLVPAKKEVIPRRSAKAPQWCMMKFYSNVPRHRAGTSLELGSEQPESVWGAAAQVGDVAAEAPLAL